MQVTDIKIYEYKKPVTGVKAVAEVCLDNELVLRGLMVMDGLNGLYVAYPEDPHGNGETFAGVISPKTRVLREHIENEVIAKYQRTPL